MPGKNRWSSTVYTGTCSERIALSGLLLVTAAAMLIAPLSARGTENTPESSHIFATEAVTATGNASPAEEIGSIVDLMLADLRRRLADKQLNLVVTDAAKNAIIDGGYDPIYGARPLKRYIQAHVETMIAKEIIGGSHAAGDTLTVDADAEGKLVLR